MSSGEFIENLGSEPLDETSPLPRRRKSWVSLRRDWPLMLLIGGILSAWVLYAVLLPQIEIRQRIATTRWRYSRNDPAISYFTHFIQRTVEFWFTFWFFYLGASIGSFINVVASRTPRGKTIVSRGSHCPFCDNALNMIDNSPVFGWIMLRGRCRACRLPISPRYLTMEIIVGAMFMILGGLELIGNGINLPYRDWSYGAGIVSTVFYPKWDLIGALVMHASLFAIGMMLIGSQMDRLRFPGLPLFIILLIYFTVVSLVRVAAPIRWAEPFGAPFERPLGGENILTVAQRAITSGIGGLVGWFIAELTGKWLLGIFSKNLGESTSENEAILSDFRNWKWHWVILHALAGSMFGWQAILLVGLVSAVLVLLGDQFLTNKRITIKQSPEHEPQEDAAEDTKEDPTESTLPEEIPKVIKPAEGLFSRPVLALAIWIITLFLHLCFWRWIAVAWHFT